MAIQSAERDAREELAERIRRAIARERALKALEEGGDRDPDGRAAYASGRALTQTASAEREEVPAPIVSKTENSITLDAVVERNGRKLGIGGGDRLGNLELKLKKGGSITGTLALQYLNAPIFEGLSKLRHGTNSERRFKVTLLIEEA